MASALLAAGISGWQGGNRFPDATNTGATLGTLTPVSSGSGTNYSFSGSTMTLTGSVSNFAITGAVKIATNNVTISGCSISNGLSVIGSSGTHITGTTISNCAITSPGGGSSEVVELNYSGSTTIKDCTISGTDSGPGRASYGIDDNQGVDAPTVLRCNIYYCRIYVSVQAGLCQDNYMHDSGYIWGDHTDGIDFEGSIAPMSILHNTILVPFTQTSPIHMNSTFATVTGVTVDSNLLAGGGYAIYCGNGGSFLSANPLPPPENMVITNNAFSTMYFDKGGLFGTGADYNSGGTGNVWSGNYWYDGNVLGHVAGDNILHP